MDDFKSKQIRKRPLHVKHRLKKLREKTLLKLEERKQQKTINYNDFGYDDDQPKTKKENSLIYKQQKLLKILIITIIILALPVVGWAGFQVIKAKGGNLAIQVLSGVGKSLPVDNDGYTNFLLLGTGDDTHEGKDLTDTILVASLHQKKKIVIMTSIPRDLFISKSEKYYGQKINSYYATALAINEDKDIAYQELENVIKEITNRQIHRRIRINFSTFEKIVDAMGGITINVPQAIYDPEYPNNNFGYQTFRIAAGLQTIDGATALKYARSRHTTSDFDRSRRQQELLFAIKETAKNQDILTSPSKIKKIYDTLNDGIQTNLESREIIELASIAAKFDRDQIVKVPLHDNPVEKGGFLYTPPRELYGNAFVLKPLGDNYQIIHLYLGLHYNFPQILNNNRTLQILNGTKIPGLATTTKLNLQRFGFNTIRFGNANQRDLEKTTLYIKNPLIEPKFPQILEQLIDFQTSETLPVEYLEPPYLSESDYILELGSDFPEILNQLNKKQIKPIFTETTDNAETLEPDSDEPENKEESTSEENYELPTTTE